MRYAFFPGCVLEGAAKEAYTATVKVAEVLGIELVELTGWTCCGASHLHDVDEAASVVVNARNIALAEELGLPLLTVCNTCTLMLRKAKAALDSGEKNKANEILKANGLEYRGSSQVTHFLWALIRDYGLDKLHQAVVKPLTGLRVAGYYGCHILRPPQVMDFEDHAAPHSLEDLITALGAEPVDFTAKLKCCGFHAFWTAERDVLAMTGENNLSAINAGAQCVVTPCPLCQMQLDMYQPEGQALAGTKTDIPVFHLAQLIGLALGLTPRELGMNRHIIPARLG
jgi:succinate dehydrogenase / fumarate reductase cytochrome b subunit